MNDRLIQSSALRTGFAFLLILILSTAATAQMIRGDGQRGPRQHIGLGGASMEHLLHPDFHARDLAILAQQLELDQSQRPIFEMLIEDYRDAFRDAAYELDRALRHRQLQRIEERLDRQQERLQRRLEGMRGPRQLPPHVAADDVRTALHEAILADQRRAEVAVTGEPSASHEMTMTITPTGEDTGARVSIDGVKVTGPAAISNVSVSAQSITMQETVVDGSPSITIVAASSPLVGSSPDAIDRARGPYVMLGRFDDGADESEDGEGDRAISPEVRERIEQMRDRIRRRMEERLEQQREEMRQRGIDPDEEIEPLETDEIAELAHKLLAEKSRLREQFERDAHLLLAPWQRQLLPGTLRIIRRLNAMPASQLSGEQVDLVRVLDDERLLSPNHHKLEAIIEEYEVALDERLTARTRFLERADIDRFIARHEQEFDTLLKVMDGELERRVAVRTVNEAFAEQIAEVLVEDERERFERAFVAQAFPDIARSSPLERLLPHLVEHDGLTDEQREAVADLHEEHAREAENHRHEAMQSAREGEVAFPREMLEFILHMQDIRAQGVNPRDIDWREIQPPTPPEYATRYVHYHLDQPYFERLRGILPTEQLDQIAEENESVRSLIDSLGTYRNYRYRGGRGWQRRR